MILDRIFLAEHIKQTYPQQTKFDITPVVIATEDGNEAFVPSNGFFYGYFPQDNVNEANSIFTNLLLYYRGKKQRAMPNSPFFFDDVNLGTSNVTVCDAQFIGYEITFFN